MAPSEAAAHPIKVGLGQRTLNVKAPFGVLTGTDTHTHARTGACTHAHFMQCTHAGVQKVTITNNGKGSVNVAKASAAALFTVVTALPLRMLPASQAEIEVYVSEPGICAPHAWHATTLCYPGPATPRNIAPSHAAPCCDIPGHTYAETRSGNERTQSGDLVLRLTSAVELGRKTATPQLISIRGIGHRPPATGHRL